MKLLDEKDYIIGGVWKLQGLHKDAYSFSQRVRVYSQKDNSNECYGYATYGTACSEDETGSWSETEHVVDELSGNDYPKGTYGTFVVDISTINNLSKGFYTCELTIIIDQIEYILDLEFEVK